jgi:hypothetical protein
VANTLTGNVWYVDTEYAASSDDITDSVRISCVVLTVSAAGGRIVLKDPKTGIVKLDLKNPTDESSAVFDFSSNPIFCPNGLRAATLTDAVAMVIGARGGE